VVALLRVDNFVTVSGKKVCDMLKVSKFCQENVKTWMSVKLNILCIVCINVTLENYHKFDNEA